MAFSSADLVSLLVGGVGGLAAIVAAVYARRSLRLQERIADGLSVGLVLDREAESVLRVHAYFRTNSEARSQITGVRARRPHGTHLRLIGQTTSVLTLEPKDWFVIPRHSNAHQFFVQLPPGAVGVLSIEFSVERSVDSGADRPLKLHAERQIP